MTRFRPRNEPLTSPNAERICYVLRYNWVSRYKIMLVEMNKEKGITLDFVQHIKMTSLAKAIKKRGMNTNQQNLL